MSFGTQNMNINVFFVLLAHKKVALFLYIHHVYINEIFSLQYGIRIMEQGKGFGWEGGDKGALIDRGGGGDGGLEGEYGEKI